MSTELETTTNDPAVGKTVTQGDRSYRILSRTKDHYKCQRDDGASAWIRADEVARKLGMGTGGAVAGTADAIIAEFQRGTSGHGASLQARAQRAMADMERMRAGLDPLPMDDADRASILSRVASGPSVVDAETRAKVEANLRGHKAGGGDNHKSMVEAQVVRFLKR